jgi:myo-inositol catabolism protein IolC
MLGYNKNLYVLPFDHRSSFVRKFIGDIRRLGERDIKKIKEYKWMIFRAFLSARNKIKEKNFLAILIDDRFGLEILKEAKRKKILTILAVEESGKKVFTLRHGKNFGKNLLKLKPDFIKALLHYNPANKNPNRIQRKRLKELDDFCKKNNFKLIVELLVPPTDKDLKKVRGDKNLFDKKNRTGLLLKSIQELRKAKIEPDIWKLEAAEDVPQWNKIVSLVKQGGRGSVGVIMLGRGEDERRVIKWIKVARQVEKLNGFAIGRTVFFEPLLKYKNRKITRQGAIKKISANYLKFIYLWKR